MPRSWRGRSIGIAYLFLAGVALVQGGCVAAAVGVAAAGGGATVGYLYYQGRVTRDYPANFDDVWAALHTSLAELGLPVVTEKRDGDSGTLESRTGDNDKVLLDLEMVPNKIPAEGPLTRVGVRVATFGDGAVSDRIFERIGAHLVPGGQPRPVTSAAPPTAPQTAAPPLLPAEPQPVAPTWQPRTGQGR